MSSLEFQATGPSPCRAGEIIVEAFIAEGVETLFGIVGSHVIGLYDALADAPSIRPITPKHEVGAAFMAAAYARVTGNPGVCVTTAGPGVLNALNGLAQARFSALPVVMVSGAVPRGALKYELHGLVDERYTFEAARTVVKHAHRVSSIGELPAALSTAFAQAKSGRPGPVYVEVPWDLFRRTLNEPVSRYSPTPVQPALFAVSQPEHAAGQVSKAARVAIVLDKMLYGSAALPGLFALARERNWRICTTRDGMNLISHEDAIFGGVVHDHKFGRFGFETLAAADLCIAIGFDRGGDNLQTVRKSVRGQLLELCTYDEDNIAHVGLTRDESLAAFRTSCQASTDCNIWPELGRPRDGAVQLQRELHTWAQATPIHFGYALSRLSMLLDDEGAVIHDTGSHEVWARSVIPPRQRLFGIGGANWATMGHAIPTAAGVRAARPDTRVICITGDGCLLMSLMDLPTLIQLGGPTVIVNLNDSEYGMITHVQQSAHGRAYATQLPVVDYARVASEFGAKVARVEKPEALDEVFRTALHSRETWFIDVIARSDAAYPEFAAGL